ncbi:MAG: hypothetical protein P8163_08560 [Candidatus Thiodiazotropha sp.]
MKTINILLTVILLTLLSGQAAALWSATSHRNTWYIKQGDVMIPMPDEKTAKKTAKKNNKAIKRGKKRTESVYDDGSGTCDNPLFNC